MENDVNEIHGNLFYRSPIKHYPMITKGEGIFLFDDKGNKFIDGSGGPFVVNIGHGVKEVNEAIYKQAEQVAYVHNAAFTTRVQEDLAAKVTSLAPSKMNRVFFVSGGSEAVESSIKLARQYHFETGNAQKYKVISLWQGFHGSTLGALSLTREIKRRKYFYPLLIPFPHIPSPYCYRCYYGKTYPECGVICAHVLESIIQNEGEQTVSAFIAEPIMGVAGGAITPPPEYFPIIREICDTYNVLMIADEIVTGFGRTGKPFGIMHWDVTPDIMTCAKGICSGYVPLGAVIAHERVHSAIKNGTGTFSHGFTFSGSPVSCAAGLAVLNYLEANNLISRAKEMGDYLKEQLNEMRDCRIVGDVRGKGLMIGLELVRDKSTKEPFDASVKLSDKIGARAQENGLIVRPISGLVDGTVGDCIMVGPPFIVEKEEIDLICAKLTEAIAGVEKEVV
ncbi:MAG: aspartate aminotransferase family protein [Deltaproteobacteria bacterium]|nr:aspartate aminotransferase family protein [Deltaproteobacteria bacterium]MBW2309102.1 aspartate aminotransferase family protein [Deltaproteobacteria bacterium]